MHHPRLYRWLPVLTAAAVILALLAGRYPVRGLSSPWVLWSDPTARLLLLNLRSPRVAAALLLGAVLGGAGVVFQMLFANPLVEPGFLGVSQGASFGAALAILYLPALGGLIQLSAGVFALAALLLSWFMASKLHFGGWIIRLLLSGLATAALFSSGTGILKTAADPLSELPEITFWMLGGLWGATWNEVLPILPAALLSLVVLYALRWRLNLLSFEDRVAASLGASPVKERLLLLSLAAVAVAAVTSVAGIVGWVGLLVPAVCRRLFSADARILFPAALHTGAVFTLICDTLARTVTASEIPLGILTSLLGAFFFILLLSSGSRRKR